MTEIRAPRRRNATRTKASILDAAGKAFSQAPYSQVGVREIASIAGVSPSLIERYFRSKAGLFEAAILENLAGRAALGDRSQFGVWMSRRLIAPDRDIQGFIMMVLSAGDPEADEIISRISQEQIIDRLAKWLGPPNAQVRAIQINMIVTGFMVQSKLLPVWRARGGAVTRMLDWITATIQALVDQSEESKVTPGPANLEMPLSRVPKDRPGR